MTGNYGWKINNDVRRPNSRPPSRGNRRRKNNVLHGGEIDRTRSIVPARRRGKDLMDSSGVCAREGRDPAFDADDDDGDCGRVQLEAIARRPKVRGMQAKGATAELERSQTDDDEETNRERGRHVEYDREIPPTHSSRRCQRLSARVNSTSICAVDGPRRRHRRRRR
jgi:hypothetical protein